MSSPTVEAADPPEELRGKLLEIQRILGCSTEGELWAKLYTGAGSRRRLYLPEKERARLRAIDHSNPEGLTLQEMTWTDPGEIDDLPAFLTTPIDP